MIAKPTLDDLMTMWGSDSRTPALDWFHSLDWPLCADDEYPAPHPSTDQVNDALESLMLNHFELLRDQQVCADHLVLFRAELQTHGINPHRELSRALYRQPCWRAD